MLERRRSGSLLEITSSSRLIHLDKQENNQTWQEGCMDEQGAPDYSQDTKEGSIQDVKAGTGDLGGICRHCPSMERCA